MQESYHKNPVCSMSMSTPLVWHKEHCEALVPTTAEFLPCMQLLWCSNGPQGIVIVKVV